MIKVYYLKLILIFTFYIILMIQSKTLASTMTLVHSEIFFLNQTNKLSILNANNRSMRTNL